MANRASSVLTQAMALGQAERAELAGLLLESLEPPSDAGVEEAWREEVQQRLASLDSGKAKLIPWEEVREQLVTRMNAR